MRRAFHEEGEAFHAWLTSLVDGEEVEQGMALDPADMHVEVPDIPVAGSGEAPEQGPGGPDDEQNHDE